MATPPVAERYDESLREELAGIPERRARQFLLLDWWFRRILMLPKDRVIRYEDIIASRGRALAAVVPAAGRLDEPLDSKNANPLYNRADARDLGERLLENDGAYWSCYSRREVEKLLPRMGVTGYQRGYADAATMKEARALVDPDEGPKSIVEELDYHAGYVNGLGDLHAGYHDPAEIAEQRGWVYPPAENPAPLGERRRWALAL